MICEWTLAVLAVGFALEKTVELKMLSSIKQSNIAILEETRHNGVSKSDTTPK